MSDLVSRLRALDTCAVSDALDSHGLPCAISGLRPLAAQRPTAGRAVTAHGKRSVDCPVVHHTQETHAWHSSPARPHPTSN